MTLRITPIRAAILRYLADKGPTMSRAREYTLRKQCSHPGCTEITHYRFTSQRDYRESSMHTKDWKCTRHEKTNEVLSGTNNALFRELTVYRDEKLRMNFFDGGWGLIHGPGFKAFAEDFPAGTKLIVTASIVIPESQDDPSVLSLTTQPETTP